MKNVNHLRKELVSTFEALKNGTMLPAVAKELNRSAGGIVGTLKTQLQYAELRKEQPKIPFLEVNGR